MDEQHLKDLNPGGVSGAVRCLICLNPFRGQPVASPQPCDHVYCLACITEWAKISNSCPVDRLKFAVLYQRSCVGGDIRKIIAVEPKDGQGLEDEGRSEELSVCEGCGRSDRRHLMLLCSACDSRFHIACIYPPLATVPVEDWFCQECAPEDRCFREESEITDDEMTELLAEVVQTSTFLRPRLQRSVPVQTTPQEPESTAALQENTHHSASDSPACAQIPFEIELFLQRRRHDKQHFSKHSERRQEGHS